MLRHFIAALLTSLFVAAGVEGALDLEAGLGGGRGDQLNHGQAIGERPRTPVLRDVTEQPVLNLIPLRCARRIVMDVPGIAGGIIPRIRRYPFWRITQGQCAA